MSDETPASILRDVKSSLELVGGRLSTNERVYFVGEGSRAFPPSQVVEVTRHEAAGSSAITADIGGDQLGSGALPLLPAGDGPFLPAYNVDGSVEFKELGEC